MRLLRLQHCKGLGHCRIDPRTDEIVRLFHPRIDQWVTCFELSDGKIIGSNRIGRATSELLRFNKPPRVRQRRLLIAANAYGDS